MQIDTDGSGEIELEELEDFLNKLYRYLNFTPPTPKQIQMAMMNLDADGNSVIDYEEMKRVLQ